MMCAQRDIKVFETASRAAHGEGGGMFRYKGFDSSAFGDDVQRLEASVNDWMEKRHPRIRMMTQSPRGEHILLSFVYEEGTDSERPLAKKVAVPDIFERTMEDAELDPEDVDDTGLPEAELPY